MSSHFPYYKSKFFFQNYLLSIQDYYTRKITLVKTELHKKKSFGKDGMILTQRKKKKKEEGAKPDTFYRALNKTKKMDLHLFIKRKQSVNMYFLTDYIRQ